MMEMLRRNRLYLLTMLFIAVLAYLPLMQRIGYLNDDWYLMFDGHVGGSDFFHEIYRIDRPLRGYLMSAAFSLFGLDPLYYHLSAFLLRLASGLALFWLFDQLWPENRNGNFLGSLLFLIYPGFLSQVNPIDYQSQIFSLACGLVSVALTIHAIRSTSRIARWGYAVASILLGWVYLGLVEYFLGFEALRLVSVCVLYWRDHQKKHLDRLSSALRAFAPFLLCGGGFLVWRLFIFEAERRATDVGLQISSLFSSPLAGLWWMIYLIQDFLNVMVIAWGIPLRAFAFPLRLRDAWTGLGLAAAAVTLVMVVLSRGPGGVTRDSLENRSSLRREQLWVGFVTVLAALMPVILANRHILLPDYSRYALAPSVGAVILFSVMLENLSARALKYGVSGLLVGIAILTHYGNSIHAVNETGATRNFWWQVAWRAPQIDQGVTLIASYPGSPLSEDYFIWGPANWIYYPDPQDDVPLEIKLPAAVLTDDVVLEILSNGGRETPLRRGNYLERDFGNVLVMVQTSAQGCVRLINGRMPELSPYDLQRLFLVAPYSQLDRVHTAGESPVPPPVVLGEEPAHGWCYYYEKADLARQRGEWEAIPGLLKEALDRGNYPEDNLEWLPFLQASAVLGDADQVRKTARLLTTDKFLRLQTCGIMTDFMREQTLSNEVISVIEKNLCKS